MIIFKKTSQLRNLLFAGSGALVAFTLVIGSVVLALAAEKSAGTASVAFDLNSDRLYVRTNVWTVHLTFSPEQWEAMEPKGGPGPFGGGPGPFGGPGAGGPPGGRPADQTQGSESAGGQQRTPGGGGGPGGFGGRGFGPPGGPGGGPGGFGPSMFIAPSFLNQADEDHDGKVSRVEFDGLASKWLKEWDTDQSGVLDEAKIRAGLNTSLGGPPGQGAFRPGGEQRSGRPGGPPGFGGRGPGMMLQGAEGKRNGLASAFGIEFVYVHADLDFDGRQFKDVGVRYKGNGTFLESRGSLKRSLKIDLNEFVKGQRLGDLTVLNLQNNVTDASWMNEVLSYQLYRDAEVPAPRTAYARLYVTVPGKYERQYFGLYSLSENVDKNFALNRFGTKKGAIFKPVTPNLFDDLGDDWSQYNQTYDPKTELYPEYKKFVIDLCKLVARGSDAEFAAKIGSYIDLAEFARFMAVMVYLSDLDGILGPGQNFYLHLHPKTQLLQFIPWDQDHSFGQFGRASQEQRDNLSILKPWQTAGRSGNSFLERMFNLEAFRKLYLARMREFSKSTFTPEQLRKYVDETAVAIRPAVQEESEARLARFDKAVAGEMLSSGGFGPFGGGQGIKPIKPFAAARSASIVAQLEGKSEGQTLDNPGFPGFGGGGRGPGAGGPGGPGGGFGPGMFLAGVFLQQLDDDKDSRVNREEFLEGFGKWFQDWNTDGSGSLTDQQLRAGIDKDLSPSHGGMPPFGGPPGARSAAPGGQE